MAEWNASVGVSVYEEGRVERKKGVGGLRRHWSGSRKVPLVQNPYTFRWEGAYFLREDNDLFKGSLGTDISVDISHQAV